MKLIQYFTLFFAFVVTIPSPSCSGQTTEPGGVTYVTEILETTVKDTTTSTTTHPNINSTTGTTLRGNSSTDTVSDVTKGTTKISATTEPMSTPKVTTRMQEPQSPTPNYPEPSFPEVQPVDETIPVIRQIAVEVAVTNAGCEGSTNLTGPSCDILEEEFKDFAEQKYEVISGFAAIHNIVLSKGSVIIAHQAIYNYNDMTEDDRQLSAEDIYDRTLAPSVESKESIGSSSFTECTDCEPVKDISNLCNEEVYSVTCNEGLEPACLNNVWQCQSKCANTENPYCNEKTAFCRQGPSDTIPTCSCEQSEDGWFIGARCQFYVDRLWLIIGFSVGGGVVLIIILILVICLCQTRKELKESRKMPFEKTNEAFLLGNDHLEIDNVADSHEMDDFVNGAYITDDDEASPKPYSYVYAADVAPDYGRKGSKDVTSAHEQNPDLDKALQERAYTEKKKQNQSFWGNLEHEVIHEVPKATRQNQMNAKSVNESKAKSTKQQANGYSQKKPQTTAIPPPDYGAPPTDPFNQRYSQIISDSYGKDKKKY